MKQAGQEGTMGFAELTKQIGETFLQAKQEKLKGHPLAALIRDRWPSELKSQLRATSDTRLFESCRFVGSPGKGQWSDAPWLAILDPRITLTAMQGYYPVFLFEPKFESVCLVLGQGAQTLTEAVGKEEALRELKRRAEQLRAASKDLWAKTFSTGPFATMKRVSGKTALEATNDPWSVSVAYGKRYLLSNMPTDAEICSDVSKMLGLYSRLASMPSLNYGKEDTEIDALKDDGELPDGAVDGVKRVLLHKQIEVRKRNRKLVDAVKKKLGSTCEACKFSFEAKYGPSMAGYIEAHHRQPISTLANEGAKLKPTADDFMVLCSNCHRAIHRAGCPDLEDFIRTLRS